MRFKLTATQWSPRGFSWVEMLIVIALIGIMASVAIPSIGSITGSAQVSVADRNAQNLASVYQSGASDGVAWGATDVATAIVAVQAGAHGSDGTYFGVRGLNAGAISAATTKLTWIDGMGLVYNR